MSPFCVLLMRNVRNHSMPVPSVIRSTTIRIGCGNNRSRGSTFSNSQAKSHSSYSAASLRKKEVTSGMIGLGNSAHTGAIIPNLWRLSNLNLYWRDEIQIFSTMRSMFLKPIPFLPV
jgi:hypothetical protein